VFRGYYLESQSVGMVPRGNFTKGVAMKLLRMRNVLAVHLALVVAGKALEAGEEAESIWQVGAVIDCQPSHGGWDPVFDEPLFYELDLRTPEGEVFTAVVFTFQLRQLEQICNQLVKPGVRVEFMWWQPFWFEKVFLMSKILPLPELAGGDFNWLAIPPEEQPPDHYRLLGTQLFEVDPDMIENRPPSLSTFLLKFEIRTRNVRVRAMKDGGRSLLKSPSCFEAI
jgi:hypothetical protein